MIKTIVVLPNNLGDVIMTLPLLQGIKERDPKNKIIFFVEDGYDGGLLGNPFCETVFCFDRKKIKTLLTGEKWKNGCEELHRTITAVRGANEEPCEVINLSQHDYTSYLTTLLGAAKLLGRHFLAEGNHALNDRWSQYLYAIPFSRRCNNLHATDIYCRIAGVLPVKRKQRIFLTPAEKKDAAAFLQDNGISVSKDKIIVFQPGAAYASKRWPADCFIRLGEYLADEGYRIIITGAPAEKHLAGRIAAGIPNGAVSTAGICSFRETIALLDSAVCVISGDTATMHAAAALDKKVIALFGPTSPVETGPYGDGHVVLAGTCPKRPCFSAVCNDMQCMRSITPEQVVECVKGTAVPDDGAGVFTTEVSGTGFILTGAGDAYYRPVTADLVRSVFEERCSGNKGGSDDDRKATEHFCTVCSLMEKTLQQFMHSRNSTLLSRYEHYRTSLADIPGITAFWAALLNIRLNSIPLLDPGRGIARTIDALRETREQLLRGLS